MPGLLLQENPGFLKDSDTRSIMVWDPHDLGTLRPGTEVSRALRARNPKESEKSPKGCPAPGSPRVPKESATGSEKSPKTQLRTLLGLFSDSVVDSLGTLGLPGAGHPFGLFSDSFGAPGPKGPETSVPGRGVPNS